MREPSNATLASCRCRQIDANIKIGHSSSWKCCAGTSRSFSVFFNLCTNNGITTNSVEHAVTQTCLPVGVHFLGDRSNTGAIFLPPPRKLWCKWTHWYKVARCYYQLHVHLKRRALASSLPWNAENSRNPLRNHQSFPRSKNFRIPGKHLPRTAHVFGCRLHWIHIVYVSLKNLSRCKQGVSTWNCTAGYFAGCFKLIIEANMKPEV